MRPPNEWPPARRGSPGAASLAALTAERAFLRQVIDATPAMIFVKDSEGRFVLANKSLANCYGVDVATGVEAPSR